MADYTENVLHIATVEAGSALATVKRFVKKSSGVLAYCGAYEKAIGVLSLAADSGEQAGVKVAGIILVESGGAITQGQKVTSDSVGRAIVLRDKVQVKIKTADETRNGIAYSNDAELAAMNLLADIKYKVSAQLVLNNEESSNKNFNAKLSLPAGATAVGSVYGGGSTLLTPAVTLADSNGNLANAQTQAVVASGEDVLLFDGFLNMSSVAGALAVQWAAGTTETTGLTLKAGSILQLTAQGDQYCNGIALDDASAAGEFIRVLLPAA